MPAVSDIERWYVLVREGKPIIDGIRTYDPGDRGDPTISVVEVIPSAVYRRAASERDKLAAYLCWQIAGREGKAPISYSEVLHLVSRLVGPHERRAR